jgi:hypothetical protein
VQFPSGNWVAPAGSYRSGGGGDETVGAFEIDASLWRCSEQAGRNESERRAGLETTNVDAGLALGWGRPPPLGMKGTQLEQAVPRAIRTQRATGVMTTACLHMEIQRNTGKPQVVGACDPPTGRPRGTGRAAWGGGEARSNVEAG